MKIKKMLMKSVLVAGVATLLSAPAMAKEYKNIRIATEGAFAPWNMINSNGKLIGFDVELAEDLCKRMKVKCTLQPQEWGGIIPSLKAGKYDAIMAAMTITPKRKKVISFSRYYAATPGTFVVSKDSSLAGFKAGIDSLTLGNVDAAERKAIEVIKKAFSGKVIGVQTSTTHEQFLNKYLADDIEVRSYDSQETLDLDLESGRIDVALAAMSYWKPLLDSEKGKNMVTVGPGMTGGPFGSGVGVGVRKGDEALAEKFGKAIDEALADGTVKRLALKWFGFDASAR